MAKITQLFFRLTEGVVLMIYPLGERCRPVGKYVSTHECQGAVGTQEMSYVLFFCQQLPGPAPSGRQQAGRIQQVCKGRMSKGWPPPGPGDWLRDRQFQTAATCSLPVRTGRWQISGGDLPELPGSAARASDANNVWYTGCQAGTATHCYTGLPVQASRARQCLPRNPASCAASRPRQTSAG